MDCHSFCKYTSLRSLLLFSYLYLVFIKRANEQYTRSTLYSTSLFLPWGKSYFILNLIFYFKSSDNYIQIFLEFTLLIKYINLITL
jgi:hypothetical protein